MNINITILDNREVVIDKLYNIGTQNENRSTIFNFTFPETLSNANKKIVFITPDGNLWDLITNNSYKITNALTKYKTVSAYVWLVDVNNDIDFRSKIWKITFNDNQEADDVIPTEEEINGFDTMIAQLNSAIAEVDNIDINANKSGTVSTVTITNKEGIEKSVEINDGTDYVITEEDYRNIADIVESEISLDVPTKTSDLTNDSGFIDNTVNNLINYTLKTNTGSLIDLEINSTTYVVTLSLKDIDGTVISTDTIDLPLESVVVSGRYDNTTKQVILTLENGSEVAFSVADLVAGLQTEITSQNKLASDLVDDSNSGNKFVTTSEKNTWNAKYDKPSGGIPDTDLSSAVQTSLGKADTALQEEIYTGTITSVKMNGNTIATSGEADLGTVITEHQDITGKEDKSNKVTSIDENSTNTQYPGAKLVYDELSERDEYIEELEAQIPENTVTGTDITVTDSADMKIAEFELEGQTEQVQYEGYNLLQPNLPNHQNNYTTAGMNFILNSDGTFTAKGTTTGAFIFSISNDNPPTLENGKTYTLYCKLNGTKSGSKPFIIAARSGNTTLWEDNWLNSNSVIRVSKTINSDCQLDNIQFYCGGAEVSLDCTIEVMIYEGDSTTLNYEPYVGGTASPSPDYPQDIHVVTGNCGVKTTGKNILNMTIENTTINGVKFTRNDDGTYTANGTATGFVGDVGLGSITVDEDTVVTYSGAPQGASMSTYSFNLKKIKDGVETWMTDDLGTGQTITMEAGATYSVRLIVRAGVEVNNIVYKPQIELGNVKTSYEPYHAEQNYPVSLMGKNLFDKDNVTNGKYINTSEGETTTNPVWCITDYITVIPETIYTISGVLIPGGANVYGLYYNRNKEIIGSVSCESTYCANTVNQIIIPANVNYIKLSIYNNNKDTLQIEKGSTATPYASYYNYELCKIGDYQDYIYGSIDDWYVYKEINHIVLDGINNKVLSKHDSIVSDTRGFYLMKISDKLKGLNSGSVNVLFCNYLKNLPYSVAETAFAMGEGLWWEGHSNVIYMSRNLTTVSAVNSWLEEVKPDLYYLITPTTTKITDTTLISQLNALYKAKTYKNTTNITTTGSDLQPILKLTYKQDLQTLFNKLDSLESRIELLES